MPSGLILVIEDDTDAIFLIRHAFMKATVPNPIHVIEDGESAWAYLKGTGPFSNRVANPLPAIIFLDWKLPKKSGLEILELLRSEAATCNTPVIVLSSSNSDIDVAAAYGAGANAYMVKPNSLDRLTDLVQTVYKHWFEFSLLPTAKMNSK